jgi:cell division protein FtsQ
MGLFDLRGVSVGGTDRLSAQQIWRVSGLQLGSNLLRLPLSVARSRLRSLPWIADAQLSRRLPHTLRIDVIERVPLAATPSSAGTGWVVIADGGVIVEHREAAPEDLLRVRGRLGMQGDLQPGDVVGGDVAALLETLDRSGLVPPSFTELDLEDPEQVRLHGAESTTIHLGSLAEAPDNVRQLSALLDRIIAEDYRSIDLTYDDEAILVPR